MGGGSSKKRSKKGGAAKKKFKKAVEAVIVAQRFWTHEPLMPVCLPPDDMNDEGLVDDYKYGDEEDGKLTSEALVKVLVENCHHRFGAHKHDEANEHLVAGVERLKNYPDDPKIKDAFAQLYIQLSLNESLRDDKDAAMKYADEAIKSAKDFPEVKFHKRLFVVLISEILQAYERKAEVFADMGQHQKGLDLIHAAIEDLKPDEEDTQTFAEILKILEVEDDDDIYDVESDDESDDEEEKEKEKGKEEENESDVKEAAEDTVTVEEQAPKPDVEEEGTAESVPPQEDIFSGRLDTGEVAHIEENFHRPPVEEEGTQQGARRARRVDYSKPDQHAKNCPKNVTKDIKTLSG